MRAREREVRAADDGGLAAIPSRPNTYHGAHNRSGRHAAERRSRRSTRSGMLDTLSAISSPNATSLAALPGVIAATPLSWSAHRKPRAIRRRRASTRRIAQPAAAVGQISLAHAYQELAARPRSRRRADPVTLGDTEQRRRYLNARNTIEVVARAQGDPRRQRERYRRDGRDPLRRQRPPLGTRRLNGVSRLPRTALRRRRPLHRPPAASRRRKRTPLVTAITPEIEAMAGDAGTELSKGGMKTKIDGGEDRARPPAPTW